jgi:death-on-curing protein
MSPFLDIEDVLRIHNRQLELYGGQAGIRERGLLESALAMPRRGRRDSSICRMDRMNGIVCR